MLKHSKQIDEVFRTFEFSNSLPLTDDEFEEPLHELEQYGKEKRKSGILITISQKCMRMLLWNTWPLMTSTDARNYIVEYIGPAFDELVDKIVYTYKFTTLPNIDSLRDECKIWLTTILEKYDQSKGSKSLFIFQCCHQELVYSQGQEKLRPSPEGDLL